MCIFNGFPYMNLANSNIFMLKDVQGSGEGDGGRGRGSGRDCIGTG